MKNFLPFFPWIGAFIFLFAYLGTVFGTVPSGPGQMAVIFSPRLTLQNNLSAIIALGAQPLRNGFSDNIIILFSQNRKETFLALQKQGGLLGFDPFLLGGCRAESRAEKRDGF